MHLHHVRKYFTKAYLRYYGQTFRIKHSERGPQKSMLVFVGSFSFVVKFQNELIDL